MHHPKIFKIAWLVAACSFFQSGCSSIGGTFFDPSINLDASGNLYSCNSGQYLPRVYTGFFYDIYYYRKMRELNSEKYISAVADMPFSFIADTALLPYTIYTQLRYGPLCDGNTKKYTKGNRVEVTSGHRETNNVHHLNSAGSEFVFSVVLPVDEEWIPNDRFRLDSRGSLSAQGKNSGMSVLIDWSWTLKDYEIRYLERLKSVEKGISRISPIYLPWYTGEVGEIGRKQFYNLPDSGGENSIIYIEPLLISNKYYCIKKVRFRNISGINRYYIDERCPFRTLDGRDAFLTFSYFFDSDFILSQTQLNERADEWDQYFSVVWESLIIMPEAYQFEQMGSPPER